MPKKFRNHPNIPPQQPQPPVIHFSPEFQTVMARFNQHDPAVKLDTLILAYQDEIKKLQKENKPVQEVAVPLPLSWFTMMKVDDRDQIIFRDVSQTVDQTADIANIPRKIDLALEKYEDGKINESELRYAIEYRGTDVAFWIPSKEARPGAKENNKSRFGFLYDCWHHKKGMILQGTIKKAIISAICLAHNYFIDKYDADAFVYDDPRLQKLDTFLKGYFSQHLPYGPGISYREGQLDYIYKFIDLTLGIMKEDMLYRELIFNMVNVFYGKPIFELLPEEQKHFDSWCNPKKSDSAV